MVPITNDPSWYFTKKTWNNIANFCLVHLLNSSRVIQLWFLKKAVGSDIIRMELQHIFCLLKRWNLSIISYFHFFSSDHHPTKPLVSSPDKALYWGLDWSENIGCCWKSQVCQCPWRAPENGERWGCEIRCALPPEPTYFNAIKASLLCSLRKRSISMQQWTSFVVNENKSFIIYQSIDLTLVFLTNLNMVNHVYEMRKLCDTYMPFGWAFFRSLETQKGCFFFFLFLGHQEELVESDLSDLNMRKAFKDT